MARLPPTPATVKRLFALSGNLCAFPGCFHKIVDSAGAILGQICHIEAAEEGGQRYNENSTDEYRRSFDNLVLFCANHHITTNDVSIYPTPKLTEIKKAHETKFHSQSFAGSDEIIEQLINNYMKQENKNEGSGTQFNNQANTQNIGTQIGNQTVHNYGTNPSTGKALLKGIRPVIPHLKQLIDEEKVKATPPSKWVIDLKNELFERVERDVELIPTKHLKFRKENGRIKTDVESYEKTNNLELVEDDDGAQAILKGFLKRSDPEKNEKLKKQLLKKGQQFPAIITCDGFLINGNRRKAILEELFEETNQNPMYESMRVVILPEGISELDIRKIENRYQLQDEGKSEYSGMNRALTLRDNISVGYDLRAQLSDDPEFADLDRKEFEKKVAEFEKTYLKPLERAEEYLKTFNREKLYDTISENIGDREGRWQAFIDYSNFYHGTLTNPKKQGEYGIKDTEVRKIENAVFKIIRKRNLQVKELEQSIGKVHDLIRKMPKYLKNGESKKFILKIAEEVKEDIPEEMKVDKDGERNTEREIDEKWGNYYKKEILGNLMQAYKIVSNQEERVKPLELLEDALKKLNHQNMKIENMETSFYDKAMELTDHIAARAGEINSEVDHARYKLKNLNKKRKR